MALSAKEAAELVGMTKQGINRAINKGKLSATKNLNGEWEIEPVELFRVYQPVANEVATVSDNEPTSQSELLRKQVEMLEERLREKDDVIEDLRSQRDGWQRQAEELNHVRKLLEDKQAETPPATPRQNWWQRLRGGS